MRREVTVELSSQGFWKTGIRSDVCQVTPVNADTCTCAAVHAHGSDTCTLSTHTTKGAHSEKYTHWNMKLNMKNTHVTEVTRFHAKNK